MKSLFTVRISLPARSLSLSVSPDILPLDMDLVGEAEFGMLNPVEGCVVGVVTVTPPGLAVYVEIEGGLCVFVEIHVIDLPTVPLVVAEVVTGCAGGVVTVWLEL